MRVGVLQGVYPRTDTPAARLEALDVLTAAVQGLGQGLDLLVMPEYGNCPGASTRDEVETMIAGAGADLFAEVREVARRSGTQIAFNGVFPSGGGLRNCTVLLGHDGEIIERYDKTHLTQFEADELGLQPGSRMPIGVLRDGTRIGFATCFELYFAEYIASIAGLRPDIVVVPTYQRSEERRVIDFQMQARASDADVYLLRSSYLRLDDLTVAGGSAIVHPDGHVLARVGDRGGVVSCEIDPHERWLRPSSAKGGVAPARDIVEEGRRPLLYRGAGATAERWEGAPRVVAHRGFSRACPENTMVAFEAAIAFGSDEVELDVWPTRDRQLAVMHDDRVDRTTDGSGSLQDLDWETLGALDAGGWFGETWRGVRIPRADDVLAAIGPRQTLNLHVKNIGDDGWVITALRDRVVQLGLTDSVYLAGDHDVLEAARQLAPELARCCLAGQASWQLVDHAIAYGCGRLQFFVDYVDEREVARAHEAGIRCNVFYADEAGEAERLFDMGVDAILSNDLAAVLPVALRSRPRVHPSVRAPQEATRSPR